MKKPTNAKQKLYCNPLPIPNVPRGKDAWFRLEHGMFSHENKPSTDVTPDYRSISDPTVMYYDNKWYLYPSYGMCYYTEDFVNWHFHKTEPYCPKYSPSIVPWKNKFLLTSWFCPLYEASSPLGPFKLLGDFIDLEGHEFTPCDPGIFIDDDGRLYLYAYDNPECDNYYGYYNRIVGYELDKDNPRQVARGPVEIFRMDPLHKPWERHGRYNQDSHYGWVEGPHMYKRDGRYYLIYASPDTCDCSYVNAVYYSDVSPLDGFVCQKRNPLTSSKDSLIRGAGHGCVCDGPNNTIWAFYTIAMPVGHMYERRIGMDQIFVDENKELYCEGVTKTPQLLSFDGKNHDLGFYNLTACIIPQVSSCYHEHFGVYMTDENNLSYWQPSPEDKNPEIVFDLGNFYYVSSYRLWLRDVGLDYEKGKVPFPVRYQIFYKKGDEWVLLIDESSNNEELNITFKPFDCVRTSHIKIVLLDNETGIVDFSLFGKETPNE